MADTELAALKTVQGEVFTHNVWRKAYPDDSNKETVSPEHLADCQELLPTWHGHRTHYGMLGRVFGDCIELTMSSFKELGGMYETYGIFRGWEKRWGKWGIKVEWGGNKQETIEVQADKRIWLCVNMLLESALAWLSPVPHHHSLIDIPVKSYL